MAGNNPSMSIVPIERANNVPDERIQVLWRMVDAGYLRTLQVPLLSGRFFDASDRPLTVILLSQRLAQQLWPGVADVAGRQVRVGSGDVVTVVGVVGDVREVELAAEPESTMYFPPIYNSRALTLALRTTSDPTDLTEPLRAAVRRVDPAQPLFDIRTMDRILELNAERPRFETALLTAFAILAIVLGMVGAAGVVAYTVERRRPELALRLAVGATPAQAMRHAARSGLIASVAGLILGLIGALGLSHYLSTLLYEIRAHDPWTFAAVAAGLLAVIVVTCFVPARRASLIDPATALRKE
jgi:putative ABC transport system permease protein